MLPNVLSGANICLGIIMSWASFRYYLRKRGRPWAWIKLAYVLIGIYWAGIYVIVLVYPATFFDPVWFGQALFRPALTITLAVMAAGSIIGVKRL